MRRLAVTTCILWLAAATSAPAADAPAEPPDDAGALSLADQAAPAAQKARDWQVFVEGASARDSMRLGADSHATRGRASLDARYDATIAPGLRAVLSDRLDLGRSSVLPRESNVNTLREVYFSWQVRTDAIADIGRINLRYGAAFGYNPTDFFKAGALRSIVSPDPISLRENRQGTIVVQGQKLWSDGSMSAVFSPKLGGRPDDSTFSLDPGATNFRNRWLLSGTHKFTDQLSPQFLLYGGGDTPVQAGLNVSGLVNTSTVAYLESSIGRGRSLIAQSLGLQAERHLQSRTAVGLTYTTAFNLSLTAEAEYSSAAPNQRQWNHYYANDPANALRLLETSLNQQELPVRQALFLYAGWRNLFVHDLDLSAFVRRDGETRSREQWIETRYHWKGSEVALRWQQYVGGATSLYGSVPQSRRIEALLRVFL